MKMQKYASLAGFTLAMTFCACDFAAAADSGTYVGAAFGQSKIDLGDTSTATTGLPASFNSDESDTTWSLVVGYRFNPFLGVEGSYGDYGKGTATLANGFVFGGVTFSNIDAAVAVKGTTLAFVGTLPADKWEFSLKLGAFLANTEVTARVRGRTNTVPVQQIDVTDRESASSTETLAAIGVGYTFADHYHVKLEWTRIPKVGDENKTGEGDVNSLTLGFHYRF